MEIYLLSYGELGLKGKNQDLFITQMIKNLKETLQDKGEMIIQKTYGRLFLKTLIDSQVVCQHLERIFGLSGYTKVIQTDFDIENLYKTVTDFVKQKLNQHNSIKTFKVSARRSNKQFEMKSGEINQKIGVHLLDQFKDLSVKMKDCDLVVHIEVREKGIYIYDQMKKGAGGLPVSCSGRGVLMLSGGIDSPVAGWQMLKRGMDILPIHFSSPPYTSKQALKKVISLAKVLKSWGGSRFLYHVPFTDVQLEINETRKKNLITLLVRKAMMMISSWMAGKYRAKALITGENLGQVASQTVESMSATSFELPYIVLRPLIGFDKTEIIERAKTIETYDISIQPFEDCCTLFLPDKPKIKPQIEELNNEFERLDLMTTMKKAFDTIEMIQL